MKTIKGVRIKEHFFCFVFVFCFLIFEWFRVLFPNCKRALQNFNGNYRVVVVVVIVVVVVEVLVLVVSLWVHSTNFITDHLIENENENCVKS